MRKYRAAWVMAVALSLGCAKATAAPFAYITNYSSNTVSVIDTRTNSAVGSPISVASRPFGVAVNALGTRAYISSPDGTVTVIDAATNTAIGSPIPVGVEPAGVTVNRAGTRIYVSDFGSDSVYVVDATTNTVIGAPIPVGRGSFGAAINPDGSRVYVTNFNEGTVSVIDTSSNVVVDTIVVGMNPFGITFNPSGTRAYVASNGSNLLSVIDSASNTVIGAIVGGFFASAIAPDGKRGYMVTSGGTVAEFDTTTNLVIGSPINVGIGALGISITPDGTKVYVACRSPTNAVKVIDVATNTVVDTIIVGLDPSAFGNFIGPAEASTIAPIPTLNGWGTLAVVMMVLLSGLLVINRVARPRPPRQHTCLTSRSTRTPRGRRFAIEDQQNS